MKYLLRHIKLLICVIIILGFAGVALESRNAYKQVFDKNIQSISQLSALTIYHELDKSLAMPVMVALAMANDAFLHAWLEGEKQRPGNEEHNRALHNYLTGLRKKFNYNSVFVISAASRTYFHYDRPDKTISRRSARDVWYYDFLKSGKPYDLVVDLDEADHNALSIFVNCRIEDDNGLLLGIAGVGLSMNRLQGMLAYYERQFGLKALLVDAEGRVQAASDIALIKKNNVFASPPLAGFKADILGNKNSDEVRWCDRGPQNICMISRYVDTLGWHLIIEKDTSPLQKAFKAQLVQNAVTAALVILALLLLISYFMSRHNKMLAETAATDPLTSLPNRGALGGLVRQEIAAVRDWERTAHAFLFDVDFFKEVNDQYGHLTGDRVLVLAARLARETVSGAGMVSRWGGDEFFGILYADAGQSREVLEALLRAVRDNEELKAWGVSLSVGATQIRATDSVDSLLSRTDEALYRSKNNGRKQVSFI